MIHNIKYASFNFFFLTRIRHIILEYSTKTRITRKSLCLDQRDDMKFTFFLTKNCTKNILSSA